MHESQHDCSADSKTHQDTVDIPLGLPGEHRSLEHTFPYVSSFSQDKKKSGHCNRTTLYTPRHGSECHWGKPYHVGTMRAPSYSSRSCVHPLRSQCVRRQRWLSYCAHASTSCCRGHVHFFQRQAQSRAHTIQHVATYLSAVCGYVRLPHRRSLVNGDVGVVRFRIPSHWQEAGMQQTLLHAFESLSLCSTVTSPKSAADDRRDSRGPRGRETLRIFNTQQQHRTARAYTVVAEDSIMTSVALDRVLVTKTASTL